MLLFKSRSSARDDRTDERRLGAVEASIQSALADATREHAGLNERLADYSMRASALMGTGEFQAAEAASAQDLREIEANLVGAKNRIDALARQIETFNQILASIRTLKHERL